LSLTDRAGGAGIAAIAVGATVLIGPLLVLILSGGSPRQISELAELLGPVHVWGPLVVLLAGVVGAYVGTDRAAQLIGYMWFTEHPRKPFTTAVIWASLGTVVIVASVLYNGRHAL
jgi:uncharacterized membrane protein YeaQ/YmgE (transglycosylase-associated protein family)